MQELSSDRVWLLTNIRLCYMIKKCEKIISASNRQPNIQTMHRNKDK